MLVPDAAALADLDRARKGTLASIDELAETSRYPRRTSDIVALLVFEHQLTVQNAIVKANYDARGALDRASRGDTAAASEARLAAVAEPLVDALFSVGAAPLPGPVAGSSGFAESFEARGPRDRQGRSLRQLDLQRRVFRYPLSYLVHSSAFQALPPPFLKIVQARIDEVLRGAPDPDGRFAHVSPADRAAVQAILRETR
jgi:hypothetical protein